MLHVVTFMCVWSSAIWSPELQLPTMLSCFVLFCESGIWDFIVLIPDPFVIPENAREKSNSDQSLATELHLFYKHTRALDKRWYLVITRDNVC